MAQETITVMVCDRCERRLELRGEKSSQEYGDALREAARWHTLRLNHMGGEDSWLLCPNDMAAYLLFMDDIRDRENDQEALAQ